MAITLPHIFHDGSAEVGSGKQLMENLTVLKEALEGGAWQAVTLHANMEDASGEVGTQTVRCRWENGATVVRLRGSIKVKEGQNVPANAAALTLPAGYRPSLPVVIAFFAAAQSGAHTLRIATSGAVSIATTVSAERWDFDGITFTL